ncbi:MAG: acylase [Bacteroidetes bacterium]|nr:MAG: acylase [Bacteroidota bacterium]
MRSITIILITVFGVTGLFAQPVFDPKKIDIVRDDFGVPHIFAKTDAEVAYGLEWATAEDDVENAQFMLSAMRGLLGKRQGIDGAKIDFAVQFLGVVDYVNEHYDESIPEDLKRVLEGAAAGANAYYNKHPELAWDKKLLPVKPQDFVTGYMLAMALMGGVQGTVEKMVDGRIQNDVPKHEDGIGSNAYAFNSNKTADGNTYLAVNAHQPIEGLLSWYEAHVCSEEGWNIVGGLFHGSPTIFLGTNENLGWAHTTGNLDELDVYKLSMHPKKKNWYRIDGEWHKLETKRAKLKVALGKNGWFKIGVKKKFWVSKYGPTMKNDHGFFSLRMPALMNIYPIVQWYRMNKARNFTEFRQALEIQGLSRQNITYADKNDTIYFISNGYIPYRANGYDWKKVLPGDTSLTLWNSFLPVDSFAQFLNPQCGWLFNVNNSGFEATAKAENRKLSDYNPHIGYGNHYNNRSLRTYEIMEGDYADRKITYEDFKALKLDHTYPKRLTFKGEFWLDELFTLDGAANPEIADAIDRITAFDRSADTLDRNFPILLMTIYELLDYDHKLQREARDDKEKRIAMFVDCVKKAKAKMLQHFGTIDIALRELQVLERGGKTVAMAGGPDAIRTVFGHFMEDGRNRMVAGDGYFQLVQFTKNGPIIESASPFGASNFADSPHYTDQMVRFGKEQMKTMSLDKATVYKNAKRIYHPE